MVRFDVVIANCGRAELFWRSFDNIKGFDPKQDRLIFFDCSDRWLAELAKCRRELKRLRLSQIRFRFYRRRNWCFNHGAQLDYVRLLGDGELDQPALTFFLQEHYLNQREAIRSDTLPDGEVIDLNKIEQQLTLSPRTVVFCSRLGFRVSASVPDVDQFFATEYGQFNNTAHAGSVVSSLVIDGANLIVDPEFYLNDYRRRPRLYRAGNGGYNFTHVWETRLSKILYDQGLTFFELHRQLGYRKVQELWHQHPTQDGTWHFFHHLPQAYYFDGRDIFRYRLWPKTWLGWRRLIGQLAVWAKENIQAQSDTSINLEWSQNDRL
jgi:hypothetical protein